MTTIREQSTAALAEALDLSDAIFATKRGREEFTKHIADRLLAASPTLAADLEFAAAWRRVERALPEWQMERLFLNYVDDEPQWTADAGSQRGALRGNGPTPTAALTRLAEALEAMR